MQWFIAIIRLAVSDDLCYYSLFLNFCLSVTFFYLGLLGQSKTYIFHGRVAHPNEFPKCQFEMPVRCVSDEERTSLE